MRDFTVSLARILVLTYAVAICLPPGNSSAQENADMHAHHAMTSGVNRSTANYTVPDVKLVRADGKTVALPQELDDGRPVVMNFIYTTCTTICPLMSQTLAQLQNLLGAERDRVHLVSISIDPEQDTPARLVQYAKRFKAGPEWDHLTGTVQASEAAQRAFSVFRGDKMSHTPVTLLRAAPGKPWIRFDGFAAPEDLLHEIHKMGIATK